MKMMIDDAILCLKGIKNYGRDTFTKRSQGDWQNSLDTAIDTMRKYQKIAEIVQACGADYNSMDSYECVEEIARILIHGNDD